MKQTAAPMPEDGQRLLCMSDVSHHYPGAGRESEPAAAVDDVSLHVAANEVVCLLGPSGCGKSTLLRIAAGLERLQAGRITINGRVVADPDAGVWVPPERRHVGLVFQDSALFPHLRVLDNVAFGLDRLKPAERLRRARALLEQLHMSPYASAYPHQLSGGQQQRVALARALAPEPSLLLMDEPFASLDAGLRSQVRDDMLHVLKSSGAGTVLVTHDPEEALFMADRIALMRHGQIVQVGRPDELYCRPVDPFVARFFGQVNEIAGRVEGSLVATPLGPVAVGGRADGEPVRVLLRPEAVRIVASADNGPATPGAVLGRVVAARLLGRYSLIHLNVVAADGAEQHLHAHAHGVYLPAPGQVLELALDASQVFVFPAGESPAA
ncbi:MAG: ABC transporter ATP-binding protein [Gammaproteobacteria bacterium]|nr:ABC transporter ATP-binding protein [Gammaproteobacteria bacterium]